MSAPFGFDGRRLRLWESFLRISTLLPQRIDIALQESMDVPFTAFTILFALARADGRSLRMSELATAVNSSPSRLSHTVERLEDRGWVRRERSTQDRRGALAVLTDIGLETVAKAAPVVLGVVNHIFDEMGEHQMTNLEEIFATVTTSLELPELS